MIKGRMWHILADTIGLPVGMIRPDLLASLSKAFFRLDPPTAVLILSRFGEDGC
jgi:hypothetical protein